MLIEMILFFWCLILTMMLIFQSDKMDDMREWIQNLSRQVMDLETSRASKEECNRKISQIEREVRTEMDDFKRKLNK